MTGNADILIIDDERDICALIQGILEDEGYATRTAQNSSAALSEMEARAPDLVVLDIWLQNSQMDGLEILEKIKDDHPYLPVVMISGHGTIETAVNALKLGAYDFIEKPFKSDRLLVLIQRALETASLRKENQILKTQAKAPDEMVGESPNIAALQHVLARVGPTNSRVLITGEAGTGKDLAARLLHQKSNRRDGPYVALNCAILNPDRLEIELFGAEVGNDAEGPKTGVLEQAHGGTLLLDEVADMPLATQGKIVRVLQEQRFTRVGGKESLQVDVRILATTNRSLEELIAEGRFRQDLYYRLNVVPIDILPLRERLQDVPLLVAQFIKQYSRQNGVPGKEITAGALAILQSYQWPGNVRQLRNVIEWIMIMHSGCEVIHAEHLPPDILSGQAGGNDNAQASANHEYMTLPLRAAREIFERDYLMTQLSRFNGNISKTAQFIGMERSALHRKLRMLEIVPSEKQQKTG